MSRNLPPENVEIVERNISNYNYNFSNNNKSFGKEILNAVVIELSKTVTPVGLDIIKGKSDDDREAIKNIREDRRAYLNKQFEDLMQNIQKEEAKDDYNQERIDNWKEEIKEIMQELADMEEKIGGFKKGLLLVPLIPLTFVTLVYFTKKRKI